MLLLRAVLVIAQASTILMTWPLWQVRAAPNEWPSAVPLEWLANLPPLPFGVALLASLAVALKWPRPGVVVHLLLLAAACACDQLRLQPQCISMAVLLVGTSPQGDLRGPRIVALAHLISLWFWSGAHKLLSPAFWVAGGFMFHKLVPGMPVWLENGLALSIAELEVCLALALLSRRWRGAARVVGLLFHLGILAVLSPLGLDWNESVWPWNAALAVTAWLLPAGWKESAGETWRHASWPARIAAGALLVAPLFYELGERSLVDAPLANTVYSLSVPHATWHHADGTVTELHELKTLRVLYPPVERIFIGYFERVAAPGDELEIRDERLWAHLRSTRRRLVGLKAGGPKAGAPAGR